MWSLSYLYPSPIIFIIIIIIAFTPGSSATFLNRVCPGTARSPCACASSESPAGDSLCSTPPCRFPGSTPGSNCVSSSNQWRFHPEYSCHPLHQHFPDAETARSPSPHSGEPSQSSAPGRPSGRDPQRGTRASGAGRFLSQPHYYKEAAHSADSCTERADPGAAEADRARAIAIIALSSARTASAEASTPPPVSFERSISSSRNGALLKLDVRTPLALRLRRILETTGFGGKSTCLLSMDV